MDTSRWPISIAAARHTLATQNVDGLHLAAGVDPARIIKRTATSRRRACLLCDDRRS